MTVKNAKKQRLVCSCDIDLRRIFGDNIDLLGFYKSRCPWISFKYDPFCLTLRFLDFSAKGVFPVSINPQYMPSFLEEFRSMKLEMMIRDLHKLSHDELIHIRKEIDRLLKSEKE